MNKRPLLTIVILVFLVSATKAQEKKLVQLTGTVKNELLQPMPFAQILVLNNYRGAISNNFGNFSLVVEEADSVLISSVGYKTKYIQIPTDLPSKFYNMDIILRVDTLAIREARIYPWKSYEEFREAFVNLNLPTDDMERARRNIALIRTQIIMDHEPSARANFRYIMEQQYQQTFIQGQNPSYQLLNPFAWAKFFKALKRGDFKRKD
ncbi:MAG TPA: carboxypeptidase-like regulatory domain-containing protein [Bacteroidales bacterium]|nr:carboxypeptidase-like regulatory domain-containing protein [Bacteroidales bacterium]